MTATISTPEGRFNYALNALLQDEGGYSDDPDDAGRATNLGITQHELDKYCIQLDLPKDVKYLTHEDAAIYYKKIWWDEYHYDAINSLIIATKVFNLAVNMGAFEAHKIVQKSLNWCGYGVVQDGILGGKTIGAINEMCLYGREDDLHTEINEEARHYYETITQENPKLYKFLNGWLRRAEE